MSTRVVSVKTVSGLCATLLAVAVGASALAAKPKAKPVETPLSEAGQALQQRYASVLAELKTSITRALPQVSEQKIAAYTKARAAEVAAGKRLNEAQAAMGELNKAQGLIGHANWWISDAKKQMADAEKKIKQAKSDAERQAAQEAYANAEKRRDAGLAAMKDRQAALAKVKANEPQLKKQLETAKQELAAAEAATRKTVADLGLAPVLTSDKLDAALAKYVVLFEATPRGLAQFASESSENEKLVDQLLADDQLMLEMLKNDGATEGNYGRAMQIYTAIQSASDKAKEGTLQRLALAIALEHAKPIRQSNPKNQADAPDFVDPVARYKHYEKAFLDGELDPAFKDLSAWDYRMVVDGDEPDETLAWGREMLRTYRPDQITMPDYRWRYVTAVRTDIPTARRTSSTTRTNCKTTRTSS